MPPWEQPDEPSSSASNGNALGGAVGAGGAVGGAGAAGEAEVGWLGGVFLLVGHGLCLAIDHVLLLCETGNRWK